VSGATERTGFVVVVVVGAVVVVVVVDVVVVVESANEPDAITSVDPTPSTSARASGRRIPKNLQRANTSGVDAAHNSRRIITGDVTASRLSVAQRRPDNLPDLVDLEEETVVTNSRCDHVHVRSLLDVLRELIL
jgi:hypothetical protein